MEPTEIHRTMDGLMTRLLLDREQVAELLGVPTKTVDYLHRVQHLQAVKIGKFNRWKPDAVRAYVDGLEPVR